jgi:glycosyltransferase involved in cell wall biosynthesis
MPGLKTVLYVSYDGMTDPLGQSQVIPYLEGLAAKGHRIHLLSCEKNHRLLQHEKLIQNRLDKSNIHWHAIPYTATPPVVSTMKDIRLMKKTAIQLHHDFHFDLIHCRSYIAAFVGLFFKKKWGIPFLFDMRGFWADERIDGHIWNLKNPVFKIVYKYFKKKERIFLQRANHVVSLTENAKQEILANFNLAKNPEITVIPCCVDNALFKETLLSEEEKKQWLLKLNLSSDHTIITYSGSLGTWYLVPEMLDFFKVLLQSLPQARLLVITQDDPSMVRNYCREKNIAENTFSIVSAQRHEMPVYLSLTDFALFFIRPAYSKKASSPTKMGEFMSMNIPVITNSGIGDVDDLMNKYTIGIKVKELSEKGYFEAVQQLKSTEGMWNKDSKNVAETLYSLSFGVENYHNIYQTL